MQRHQVPQAQGGEALCGEQDEQDRSGHGGQPLVALGVRVVPGPASASEPRDQVGDLYGH